jgi:hypothetical protein
MPVLFPLLCLAALLFGSLNLGPAVRAARGEGTFGTLHVVSRTCHNGCSVTGDFVSDDGSLIRTGVRFLGNAPRPDSNDSLRALDTGDPFGVFAPTGSHQWVWSILHLTGGGAGLLWWVWRYPLRAPARRRRAGMPSGPRVQ